LSFLTPVNFKNFGIIKLGIFALFQNFARSQAPNREYLFVIFTDIYITKQELGNEPLRAYQRVPKKQATALILRIFPEREMSYSRWF
jgi:hypothetical protein